MEVTEVEMKTYIQGQHVEWRPPRVAILSRAPYSIENTKLKHKNCSNPTMRQLRFTFPQNIN